MALCVSATVIQENEVARVEEIGSNSINDTVMIEKLPKFKFYDAACLLSSLTTLFLDLFFNCFLAYLYYHNGQGPFFILTVVFVIIPALTTTAFSMRWYIVDNDDPVLPKPPLWKWILRLILLLLQMAPVLRYCDAISYGLQSILASKANNFVRQDKLYRRMVEESSDASLLRLFYCFLQSLPEAVLHVAIIISSFLRKEENSLIDFQCYAVTASVISIAWSLTSYHRSVRFSRDEKENLSWQGALIQFCWHLTSSVSRILALSMLASLFPVWLGAVCICHWAVMSFWLSLGQYPALCSNRCEELIFSGALGIAYILTFIPPRDGPTRYAYLAYYLVVFMENTGILVVWCVMTSSVTNPILYYGTVVVQLSSFLLGIMSMLLYYRHFHPSGTSANIRASFPITMPNLNKHSRAKHITRPT